MQQLSTNDESKENSEEEAKQEYQLTILEASSKPYTGSKGIVLSSQTYFSGEFRNSQLHGEGTFLYLNEDNVVRKTVKGKWRENLPTELSIYNREAVRPMIVVQFLNGEREAKLILPNRTTYLGSIQFRDSHRLEEIMTGRGVINFPNRDIYIGSIRNGLMHTGPSDMGIFTSKQARTSYSGEYKNGFREGEGCLTF
jgi:hypothetical protein